MNEVFKGNKPIEVGDLVNVTAKVFGFPKFFNKMLFDRILLMSHATGTTVTKE